MSQTNPGCWVSISQTVICFFSTIWLSGFVSYFADHGGKAYKKLLCKYEGYNLWFYFGEKDSNDVGEFLAQRIVNEDGFAAEVNKNIIIESDKLRSFSETIPQTNLGDLSNEELWHFYSEHQRIHSEYYAWGWIPVCCDMFHGNLTRIVKEYLTSIGVEEENLNKYFVTLTQPIKKSLIVIEQEGLLEIGIEAEKHPDLVQAFTDGDISAIKEKMNENVWQLLEAHRATYYYTKHIWVSGHYTIEDYLQQLVDVFKTGELPSEILAKQERALEEAISERAELLDALNIEDRWRAIFDAYGDFMVTKMYRRYAQLLAVHNMSAILKEIAKRKFITEKQVRFATKADVEKMLLHDEYDEAELLDRTKECIYYAENGFEQVYMGDEMREIEKELEQEIDKDVSELKGETGCLGYGKGPVKIVIRAEDMDKMKEGDVLVSIATDPDIVPAMKKASAIVTEQGGVTSHAAIVSRELGIPCVIGTKIATKVLQDGDIVEVDAGKGIVTKV